MDISNLTNAEISEQANTDDKGVLRLICNELEIPFSGNTGAETLKTKIAEALSLRDEPAKQTDEDSDLINDEDEDGEDTVDISQDPAMKALESMLAKEQEEKEAGSPSQELKTDPAAEDIHESENAYLLSLVPTEVKDKALRRRAIRAQALRQVRVRITNVDPADAVVPGAIFTCYSRYTGKVSKYVPFEEEYYENGYHIPKIILDDLLTRKFTLRKEVKKRGSSFGVKEYKNVSMKKFVIEELPPLSKAELKRLAANQAATGAISKA